MSFQAALEFLQCDHVRIATSAVGLFVILSFVWNFVSGFYNHFLRPGKNIVKSFGKWAIVTGATDGIGKAMAFELAKKGCNIILISRTQSKLDDCKQELLKKYPNVECEVLAIDYSKYDADAEARIVKAIGVKDIGVLVNNVGISYPNTKYFHELEDVNVEQLMTLNVNSTTNMTRLVLPGMISRKRGTVVSIGSAAGVSTSPLLSQYGAAKSYIAMFSRAMNEEYKAFNISFQCQVPLFVTTKLAKLKKTSFFIPSPSTYAKSAVAAIGYDSLISPYWTHALQIWFLMNAPEWLVVSITKNMHLDIRKRAIRKAEKAKAEKKE
jgi:17beta-estradiol 17-dehydrogenase / very-long-chain 3-oxoacyl-CoA reductase